MYQFPENLRKAYESQPSAFVYDELIDGKVIPLLVSDGFCELVNMDRAHAMEWFREGQFERLHPDDVGRVVRVSEEFANHRGGYDLVFRTKHADGYHVIHAIGKWQIMPDGTELALLSYADLTENLDAMAGTEKDYHLYRTDQFYTDPLTGLPNLNYLNRFADERVHALRTMGRTPVLIYADVISMHFYNSLYGHEKGNDLLRLIAENLKAAFPDALIMRGPDDHFILLDAFEDEEFTAKTIVTVDSRVQKDAEGNTTGIKAGAYVFKDRERVALAVDYARNALKSIGTDMNRVCCFHTRALEDRFWNQRYIVENIDQALKKGWIKVYYQAISRVATGKGTAAEALARWVDPIRGILSPGEFIPVLEKYHLLHKLDLYMAEQVCRDMPRRAERGLPLLPVSVNFSAQDFDYVDIPTELEHIYEKHCPGIEPKALIIEITEQDLATGTERFREQLRRLKQKGFHIWLDDFGSGYSSLNVFSRFEVDLIKFDMGFLKNLDGANRRIMKAMTEIARELGIHTLAEGMETEEHRDFLKEIGCELAQGYLYHRPEPIESTFYRLDSGQPPRPCETLEERERQIKEWFDVSPGVL